MVEPRWKQRERRLSARDNAIREALPLMGMSTLTGAACELERLLRRYLTGPRLPPLEDALLLPGLLYQIAEANDWKPLGWRQMLRAAANARTLSLS